jgi:hypothetical protein
MKLSPEKREGLQESAESIIALGRGNPSKIYAMYDKSAQENLENAEIQNEIAWDLLTNPRFGNSINLTLAEKCAVQAVNLTQEKESDKLDTLARVRWLQGKKEEALKATRESRRPSWLLNFKGRTTNYT